MGLRLAQGGLGLLLDCRPEEAAGGGAGRRSGRGEPVPPGPPLWEREYPVAGGTRLTRLEVGEGRLAWEGEFMVTP